MSAEYFYGQCRNYMDRAVEITTRDGNIHRGIIRHVDRRKVYLQPFGRAGGLGGFAYGYGGYGGWGGFGIGIALGAIGTLALLPWFFW